MKSEYIEKIKQNKYPLLIGALTLALFIIAYFPVWKSLISLWIKDDDYSHGFFIVPMSIYILWDKREKLKTITIQPSKWGLAISIGALLVYAFAQATEIATISSLSMILLISGVVLYLYGFAMLKETAFAILFLLFMIPVPAQIYSALTINLQLLVTMVSAWVAPFIGIPIYHEGNVIHLPNRTLQVVNACSGMRSMISLLAMSAIIAYFFLRSYTLRTVLFISGVPIAVVTNIIRVLILIAAFHYFNLDLTYGTSHTILGLVIFALALGFIMLIREVLKKWEKEPF